MPKLSVILIFAATVFFSPLTRAAVQDNPYATPIGLSIFPPVQFPNEHFDVTGLRVSALMGRNKGVHGLDLGLIGNSTTQEFTGIGLAGIFNHTQGETRITGLQAAGLTNIISGEGKVYGFQLALGANIAAATDVYGVQIALYNKARLVRGVQIGLINVCDNLKGLQIGLGNFNQSGPFKVSPLINFAF